jgi:DNA polymerase-1
LNIEHHTTHWTGEEIVGIFKVLEEGIFNNSDVVKIAHNLKYEAHWLMKYGVSKFSGVWHDTMLMSHALNENTRNDLKSNVDRYLPAFSGYALKPVKGQSWADIKFSTLSIYNAIDVHTTNVLYFFFTSKLLNDDPESKLYIAYRNIHMGAFWMFVHMEHRGALIDTKRIKKSIVDGYRRLERKKLHLLEFPEVAKFIRVMNEEKINERILECEEKIKKHEDSPRNMSKLIQRYEDEIDELESGRKKLYKEINFNSVKQLQELLFLHSEGFQFPINDVTGKPDTSKEYLRSLNHDFTNTLLAYRSIKKMIGTYYEGIYNRVDENNRLHTRFNQNGTVTQRLSCADPNLQNIPTRTSQNDEDVIWAIKEVKKFFTVPEGYIGLQADYSQAELRLIANFSGDPVMQEVYTQGKDIHAMTASEIVNMSYEEFLNTDKKFYKTERNTAKSANFGLVYDISIPGYIAYIKNNTGNIIDANTAQRHKDSLFRKYSKLVEWHETYKAKARKYKYVRTLFGSKRRLPEIDSPDGGERSKAERAAINSPIQGSGGQFTVFVMGILQMVLPDSAMFFNTVHDSIFLYVRKDLLDYVIKLIIKYSEKIDLNEYFFIDSKKVVVPMKMDFELSDKSWGEMEEIDSSKYRL